MTKDGPWDDFNATLPAKYLAAHTAVMPPTKRVKRLAAIVAVFTIDIFHPVLPKLLLACISTFAEECTLEHTYPFNDSFVSLLLLLRVICSRRHLHQVWFRS